MSKKLITFSSLIVSLILCSGMRGFRAVDVHDLLPDLKKFENLSIKSGPDIYVGEDLFEYINGGADPYHVYGFIKVVTQELEFKDNKETVIVDVYDMGSADNAFGIFSFLRLADAEFPDIGAGCQYSTPALDMHKGRFLIQLAASTPFQGHRDRLIDIAKHVATRIPAKAEPPAMLSVLSVENRIPNTEKYIREAVFGFDFLNNGWSADYKLGDQTVTTTLVPFDSAEAASSALERFLEESGAQDRRIVERLGGCVIAKQPYRGLFIAGTAGKYLIHISGSEDAEILEKVFSSQHCMK